MFSLDKELLKTKLPLSEQNTALDEPSTETAHTEREQPVSDHEGNSMALATELARLKAELERVSDEKRTLAETASARIAALESELAAANTELAAARNETAAALSTDDDPDADNDLALLQDEYEALRAEYVLINDELTDRNADLQQLRNEKTAAEEYAAAELAALRTEFEQLSTTLAAANAELRKLVLEKEAAEKAAAEEIAELKATIVRQAVTRHEEPRPAHDLAAPTAAQTSPANRNHAASDPAIRELAALFTQTDTEAAPAKNGVTFAKKGPASFHLDSSLALIPCVSADDIIELRVSFNTIEMNCDGAKPQECSAYICGLERNGSKHIYVALYQIKTHKALIYVPAQQPQDPDDYGRIMQDAISFADVSGFIINLESLGRRPEDRLKVLQKIPVLDRL